jgi:hypothetical protein
MRHPRSSSATATVVAIYGTATLSEDILGRLLEREGYHVRHLEAPPTGPVEEMLEGVDVVLLSSGLEDGAREGFLKAMSTTQEPSAVSVLPLSSALKLALLDELSAGASWSALFEELTSQIGAALGRAGAFVVECCCCGAELRPAPEADAL